MVGADDDDSTEDGTPGTPPPVILDESLVVFEDCINIPNPVRGGIRAGNCRCPVPSPFVDRVRKVVKCAPLCIAAYPFIFIAPAAGCELRVICEGSNESGLGEEACISGVHEGDEAREEMELARSRGLGPSLGD